MPFTIHTHSNYAFSQDWSEVAPDRVGYKKYEASMTPSQRRRILISIVALSILTLGIYFVYLKGSKNGKQELANLRKRLITHYVKIAPTPPLPPSPPSTDTKARDRDDKIDLSRRRIPLEASVMLLQRDAFTSIEGQKVQADPLPIECLVIKGTNGRKFGFKIVPPDHPNSSVVVFQKNGSKAELCIDTDDTAKRLFWQASDGPQEVFFQKEYLPAALNNFERLQAKNSAIDPNLLMQLIKGAFERREKSSTPSSTTRGVNLTDSLPKALLGRTVVAGFRGDKLTFVDLTHKTLMVEGGEAKLYTARSLVQNKEIVVKAYELAKHGALKPLNEMRLLEQLHESCSESNSKKRLPGIQKPYLGLMGVEAAIYNVQAQCSLGNLIDALGIDAQGHRIKPSLFTSLDEKLLAYYRLICGLHTAYTKIGFIHGDIKARNILALRDKASGRLVLDLADFGSAQLCDPNTIGDLDSPKPWTKEFVLLEDIRRRNALAKAISQAEAANKGSGFALWKEYIENGHKMDVLALARVFAVLLVQNPPFDELENQYIKPNSFRRQVLIDAKIPVQICDLIKNMLETDFKKRMDSQAVLTALRAIMQARGLII